MKRAFFFPWILTIAMCASVAEEPAAPAPGTVERAAHDQLQALRAANWQSFTAQMHPKALARFKEQMIPVAAALWKSEAPPALNARKAIFANIPLERLEASSPEILFERFMQNFAALNPGLTEAYKATTPAYLGQVREGDIVHLVARYNREAPGGKVSEVTVASFEQDAGVWKALLSSELEQLSIRLRGQFLKTP